MRLIKLKAKIRTLTGTETEQMLRNRILKYWGFERIVFLKFNKWLSPYGTIRNTNDVWDMMNFYQKPLPF